jgi:rod shape-determining protein MreC
MSIRLRPRHRILCGCLLVISPLMIPTESTSEISITCVSAFAPVQRPMARAGRLLASSLDFLSSFRGSAAAQNRKLRQKVAALTEERDLWRARAVERNLKLKALGDFRRYQRELGPNEAVEVEEAEVIGQGGGAQQGLIFIDRGSSDGLAKGMAVVAGRSIAGIVRAVSSSVSSVLLVTSPTSNIRGRITSTNERGIVVGNGDGTMHMTRIWQTKPSKGDSVMTTGLDGTTPRHFVLGTIVSVDRRPGQLVYEVTIRPLRQLDRLANVVAVRPAVSAGDLSVSPARELTE